MVQSHHNVLEWSANCFRGLALWNSSK